MKQDYDVIIIGTGAMGSATAFHLARRKKKILGIDRFLPPHSMGSSHGQTRIIREAYFEDPQYVPLIQHSYTNWGKLEKEYGQPLFLQTGGLMMGLPGSTMVVGARRSAELHHLPYEELDATQIRKKFPAFHPGDDTVAIWEPRAGILYPEKCIDAHIQGAVKYGAEFLFNEPALEWEATPGGVCVATSNGKYYAQQLVLTAGAWLKQLLPGLDLALTVERQVVYWFAPSTTTDILQPGKFPVFIWSPETGSEYYGFADLGRGIKVARHHRGELTDPDTINRYVKEEETELMRPFLRRFIPAANGKLLATETCMYTNTADFNFRIFHHPQYEQVLVASICSGHGFKFSSAFGEILADLLTAKKPGFNLSLFMQTF